MADSNVISKPLWATSADPALMRAAGMIAAEAESIATQIERGSLPKCDGPTALRLFAGLVRTCNIVE